MASASVKVSQRTSAPKNQLEQEKSRRQEESRKAVASGARPLSDNFFIQKEVARRYTYVFKG